MVDTYANRVHVDTSSAGTADLTLGAAISAAYQSFAGAGITNGATFPYTAYTATQFECGHGAYSTTGPTLDRTAANVVAGSAGAGALTNFSGNPRVFLGPLAEDWPAPGGGATPAGSSGQVQYNDAAALGAANLWRESADALAQRNGTTAQAHYVYNTYTDASNYERLKIVWASNTCTVGTEKAGSGTARPIVIDGSGGGVYAVTIQATNAGSFDYIKISAATGIDFYVSGTFMSRFSQVSIQVPRTLIQDTVTVGALGSAATVGMRCFVTDSSVTTFGTTVAGGGSTAVPVYSDGTNWKVG